MPGLVKEGSLQPKRKRGHDEQDSLKRTRSDSSDDDVPSKILLLENEIFESKKHYNNISSLIRLQASSGAEEENGLFAAISLCRVFSRLMASEELSAKKKSSEKNEIINLWLKERFHEYKTALLKSLSSAREPLNSLTLCMRTLKAEGTYLSGEGQYTFPVDFLTQIVLELLRSDDENDVRAIFGEKFVEEYDDIRFYVFKALETILAKDDTRTNLTITKNALDILTRIESVPEVKEELEDFYVPAPEKPTHTLRSLSSHKKQAQGAWLAYLKRDMNKDQRKKVLSLVSSSIAPWFMKPELLMDFLTDSYNAGGSTSLNALSGVFYLIQERNLDYPLFYRKLYSLLDAEILHSRHRSKFFRLLDTFMSSTHLPAALVASFLKRLSRLAIYSPPAGIVAVIPWIYNLLKRHPTCTFMIHRELAKLATKDEIDEQGMEDPFITEEEDPMETQAIESSLWELVLLQSHYHPNVATLAKIISEQFTKHAYNLEDFLDHSYGSMLDGEFAKDVKKIPVIEYEIPKRILLKDDSQSGVEDSLLVKLWDFSQNNQ